MTRRNNVSTSASTLRTVSKEPPLDIVAIAKEPQLDIVAIAKEPQLGSLAYARRTCW